MTYTYKQIVRKLEDWFNNHYFVNRFTSGDYDFSQIDKAYPFPHVHIQPASITYGNVISYTFDLTIMDLIRVEEVKQEYILQILNDTAQVIHDFQSYMVKGDGYFDRILVNFEGNAAEARWDFATQNVAGWQMTFTIQVPNQNDICSIPQSGATPEPPPDCQPATILDVDGNVLATILSGGNLTLLSYRIGSSSGSYLAPVSSIVNGEVRSSTLTDVVAGFNNSQQLDLIAQNIVDGASSALEAELATLICSCDDGTVNVNGSLFNTVASGGTLNVPVEYPDGTAVGTITDGVVVVPDVGAIITPEYVRPLQPVNSYATYDLGWQWTNGVFDRINGNRTGRVRVLGANKYTLNADTPNFCSTTDRFTFDNGDAAWNGSSFITTYPAGATDYVIIDHLTHLVWYVANLGYCNWTDAVANCFAHSAGGFTWRIPSENEFQSLHLDTLNNYHSGGNIFRRGVISGDTELNAWCSITREKSTTNALRISETFIPGSRAKTDSSLNSVYPCANYDPV